jgi:hypothetical protein
MAVEAKKTKFKVLAGSQSGEGVVSAVTGILQK